MPVPERVFWWAPDFSRRIRASESEAAEHLVHLMRAAVTDRMVADVPLGAFLSGGVDSSAVVALMAEASAKAVKRSEEHTSELQSLMRISYAVFCLKKKTNNKTNYQTRHE